MSAVRCCHRRSLSQSRKHLAYVCVSHLLYTLFTVLFFSLFSSFCTLGSSNYSHECCSDESSIQRRFSHIHTQYLMFSHVLNIFGWWEHCSPSYVTTYIKLQTKHIENLKIFPPHYSYLPSCLWFMLYIMALVPLNGNSYNYMYSTFHFFSFNIAQCQQ